MTFSAPTPSRQTSEFDLTEQNTGPGWRQYLRVLGPVESKSQASSHSMQQCRLGQERHLLWSELGDGDFAMLGGRKLRGQGEGECGAASGGI